MRTNSNMGFKIHVTQFAVGVMILKLHCSHYSNERSNFLKTSWNINWNIFYKNNLQIAETLPYCDNCLDGKIAFYCTLILNDTIDSLFVMKKLDVNLFKLNMDEYFSLICSFSFFFFFLFNSLLFFIFISRLIK